MSSLVLVVILPQKRQKNKENCYFELSLINRGDLFNDLEVKMILKDIQLELL